jgi:hypothetical protein
VWERARFEERRENRIVSRRKEFRLVVMERFVDV